ncbi:MAG: hypothetical protein KKF46_07430 [Nanoarchaeota archaeon]|nr:hypothetical protein [Nanoarchaeota archaeon]MBU1322159.1 hypothetical protein [Nanoarchaeota archaeon]MBU1597880.1 hypothetical protein [Nanoarchaeota archaeon]MBU2441299.1 hypothetical protein [Nanoarchaeota archaeon]
MGYSNKSIILATKENVLSTYKSRLHGLKALSKYDGWFPIRASPRLAGIVADLMGDGHLQGEPKSRLDYSSNSVEELERFNSEIFCLFGLKGKIRKCTTNKYGTMNLGVNNKPLGRILRLIGVPTGAKVLTKFGVPYWILIDKKLFSRFINRLFSCEATVDVKNKFIEIKMYKEISLISNMISFFQEIEKFLFIYFNIKSTKPFLDNSLNIRKDGKITRPVRLKIKRKEALVNYQKHIGFDDLQKQVKLEKIT